MKQIVVKKGNPLVAEVCESTAVPGCLLVGTRASCVSPGTEMAGLAAAGKSLLRKMIDKPEKVLSALAQVRGQGVAAVWSKARHALEIERAIGYSAAGVVLDVGPGVEGFARGMRVAVAGAGHANHAEYLVIPKNLAVAIPDGVEFAEASSVALGAIAMQGVRRAGVTLGEKVAVVGCGALGMLAVQMLKAAGCKVFATDLDDSRLALALRLGADAVGNPGSEDIVKFATHWSGGCGVDAVLIFAATSSAEPLSQSFQMCRRKGRVVLVGVAGNEYKRDDMYAKELDFLISTSYGPGRYDETYELEGHDYPIGYVRWTENRNMAAYLDLLAGGTVDVAALITVREPVERAPGAYEKLKSADRPLLAVLEMTDKSAAPAESRGNVAPASTWSPPVEGAPLNIALVGAGSFVMGVHVPIIKSMAGRLRVPWSCSKTGLSARNSAAAIPGCGDTTDYGAVLADLDVHAVLIGTRHNSHAELAVQALRAGKGVFVEKPMCLTVDEFDDLAKTVASTGAPYMVGYNRRFSPFAERIRKCTERRINPLMIQYTMNAGYLPREHWTQGREGGGRLLGEACHIVDLFRSLVGHAVTEVSCHPVRSPGSSLLPTDNFSLTLSYADGSVANLIYTAQGNSRMAKESMRVFFDEKIIVLDDYLTMRGHGLAQADLTLKAQDKGHAAELEAFHSAVMSGKRFPIPWDELVETWQITRQADQICRIGDTGGEVVG